MSWTSGSPTTNRWAMPTATPTFSASRTRAPRRGDHLVQFRHRTLHGQRAGGRARAVVAVDPAGDRVAAEVDDVAAEAVELGDERVEDAVEVRRQHLGATLRAQLVGQRLGQRREARDVGEQRCAVDRLRYLAARRERAPAVTGNVGVRVVEAGVSRARSIHRISLCPVHVFLVTLARPQHSTSSIARGVGRASATALAVRARRRFRAAGNTSPEDCREYAALHRRATLGRNAVSDSSPPPVAPLRCAARTDGMPGVAGGAGGADAQPHVTLT